jgi:hypothetical protein
MLRRGLLALIVLGLFAVPAAAQQTEQSTGEILLDAVNECAAIDVAGMGRASFDVSGDWIGTITFYVLGEGGTPNQLDVAKPDTPGTTVNTTTANGIWAGDVAGFRSARACLTAYTSGTARIFLRAAASGGGGSSGGAAGGGGTTTDPDDDSIAAEQTNDNVNALGYMYSGAAWIRMFGTATGLSVDSELAAPAALADNSANPTVTGIATYNMCFDGATWDRCPTGDGGAGVTSANTARTVDATVLMKRYISAGATEDESEVKATAGVLRSVSARNAHSTAAAHLKCTNATAANTTPGTTAIFYEMIIPPAGGFVDTDINAAFSTALTCYIVLGKADNAVDEVAASDVSYNLRYE